MQIYNIYSEGYQATGECGRARFIASVEADNFLEAARKACEKAFGVKATETYFSAVNGIPAYWGCQLFDNLSDAAKAFG